MENLNKFFTIKYGNKTYSDKSVLDNGETILIASQGVDNGTYGFFDIPISYKPPIITVPRTGSIGFSFVQLYPCTVTDDCMVLTPIMKMETDYLFYVAAVIRFAKWRYNYGRKITPKRLSTLKVIDPEKFQSNISYNLLLNDIGESLKKLSETS